MENIIRFELKNGFRVLFYPDKHAVIGHCALMIAAGTRHEEKGKEGLAHFLEHMMFKGTKKRKSVQILNRLELVGGELNAFTSKEETCIHASFLTEHLFRSAELIADIALNSVFPVKEIKKEKEVVKDEIRMYLDTPSEQIFDDFEAMLFEKSTLGTPILGSNETLEKFTQKDLHDFISSNYFANKMALTIYGNYTAKEVEKYANQLFGDIAPSKNKTVASPKLLKTVKAKTVAKETAQCHYLTGVQSYSLHDKRRTALVLLNNILGGPGMNSRLNLAVREKYGYTYAIESGYNAYTDTGVFHLYLATDKKYLDKSISLAQKELKKFCERKISSIKLNQSKMQFKGQLALANENKASITISSAKSMLYFNKAFIIEEVINKIEAVTPQQMFDIANEIFDVKNMSSLLYQSKN